MFSARRLAAVFACTGLLVLWSPRSASAVPDLGIVVNGGDNTLSTFDPAAGSSTLGVAGFPAFPGEAVIESGRLYVAVSGADQIRVFDPQTLDPVDVIAVDPGANPYDVAGDGSGNILVSLLRTGEAVRFDAAGNETGRIATGRSPQGVLFHAGRWYVANTGFRFDDFGYDPGTVAVIDDTSFTIAGMVAVGLNPQGLAQEDGAVHVVCTGDYVATFGESHVFDAFTLAALDTVPLGGSPGRIAVGDGVAVTSDYFGGLFLYATGTGAVLHDAGSPLAFGGSGYSGLALDGLGNLYVTLHADDLCARVRLDDAMVTGTFATGDGPGDLVLRDDLPVPVLLTAFDAVREGAAVRLRWKIADPAGVAELLLAWRPGPAGPWRELDRFPASRRGETVHIPPQAGSDAAVEYRLSARFRDGTREDLGTVLARGAAPGPDLVLAANPVRHRLSFRVTATPGLPTRLDLLDVAGRRLRGTVVESGGFLQFDVAELPSGVYFLRALSLDGSVSRRVVITR